MKKAVSMIETALIASVVIIIAVNVMNSTGKSITKLAKQTTAVNVRK